MDVSLAAKARGVKAFQAGSFEEAVREFTDAITKASSDEALDALHTFHGNRCASYQHLQLFDKASEDAEACTQIKPTWSKGWAHLGNCKSQLGLYSEAASAYRKVSMSQRITRVHNSFADTGIETRSSRTLGGLLE